MSSDASTIARRFDAAAGSYDSAADLQTQVAEGLVQWIAPRIAQPHNLIDIGCGTGLVTGQALQRWPSLSVTAFDAAPAMLAQVKTRYPNIETITGDAAAMDLPPDYDLALSSMALHWLPDPLAALQRWRKMLRPGGMLGIALPVAGSFKEWRNLAATQDLQDGLWGFPTADFADHIAARSEQRSFAITYPNAWAFLRTLKITGAATPKAHHKSWSATTMRRLLATSPVPFSVSCNVLYLAISPIGSD